MSLQAVCCNDCELENSEVELKFGVYQCIFETPNQTDSIKLPNTAEKEIRKVELIPVRLEMTQIES